MSSLRLSCAAASRSSREICTSSSWTSVCLRATQASISYEIAYEYRGVCDLDHGAAPATSDLSSRGQRGGGCNATSRSSSRSVGEQRNPETFRTAQEHGARDPGRAEPVAQAVERRVDRR